jgi:hypothetical protein
VLGSFNAARIGGLQIVMPSEYGRDEHHEFRSLTRVSNGAPLPRSGETPRGSEKKYKRCCGGATVN